jgi:hypothetical protein
VTRGEFVSAVNLLSLLTLFTDLISSIPFSVEHNSESRSRSGACHLKGSNLNSQLEFVDEWLSLSNLIFDIYKEKIVRFYVEINLSL